jgi:hypothetical protein
MDPDLMRPAGVDHDIRQETGFSLFNDEDAAESGLPLRGGRVNGSEKGVWDGTDRSADREFPPRCPAGREGAVTLPDPPGPPGFRQRGAGVPVAGEQDDPRRPPAETVEGGGRRIDTPYLPQQSVLEVAAPGECRQAPWLGHRQQVAVLVKNVER